MNQHRHEWEPIDIDSAGCLVCGIIHSCGDGGCIVIPTEDAEVCTITGLCVRDRIWAETEYADTIASYNMGPGLSARPPTVDRSVVVTYVQQLLTSENSLRSYRMEMARFRCKVQTMIQHEISACGARGVNLVQVIETVFRNLEGNRLLLPKCDGKMRMYIVNEVSDFICFLVNTCTFYLKMTARASETRVLVFGLLYLMRTGVVVDGNCVIPRVAVLKALLPAENTLQSHHDFRPKFITDVENKFKFMFRSMQGSELRMLSLQSRKVSSSVIGNYHGAE